MVDSFHYRGQGKRPKTNEPAELPISLSDTLSLPQGYLADDGLADAVNVALSLGQPLLLTGQPGTGKTQLASSLAWELRYPLIKFETKSTSVASDLFYTYDALGRFHAAQTQEGSDDVLDYIRFNALGKAILYAKKTEHCLSGHREYTVADLLKTESYAKPRRSVVLIDEIDKAPRDFPNDLLNEIEGLYFRIPEMGIDEVRADREMRPVLVLTSNSEKNLAEAFLRRCVFYHIPFPDEERLKEIVRRRLGEKKILRSALDLLQQLRDPALGLLKKPSTGELLAWLEVLPAEETVLHKELAETREIDRWVERTLCSLIKTKEDRDRARGKVEAWIRETRE